jgi:hypothetical protein
VSSGLTRMMLECPTAVGREKWSDSVICRLPALRLGDLLEHPDEARQVSLVELAQFEIESVSGSRNVTRRQSR